MLNPYIPDQQATGVARVFRGATDLPLFRDDERVFPPDDNWTLALAEAIVREAESGALEGKKVLEMGCGSGINIAGICALGHMFRTPPSLLALDITQESVSLCRKMAESNGFENIRFFQSNLLNDVGQEELDGTDVVFACLPQVKWDYDEMQREPQAREFADYYIVPKDEIPEDAYALGLLARALDQVRQKTPEASVLFNVAGRQGDRSIQLFKDHGFPIVRPVVERVIPHDPGTSLTSFVKWEQMSGESCRFYADANAQHVINAAEAEARRVAGMGLYHDLFVIKGSPAPVF